MNLMKTAENFVHLRETHGLTQTALAEKLMVTRQAVSRWERGETLPSIDTLKLISETFQVSINTLLGEPVCQSCGIPLSDPDTISHESDGAANAHYCKWCYNEGHYAVDCTMEEMIASCLPHMTAQGFSEEQARAWLEQLLPTLDRWKQPVE